MLPCVGAAEDGITEFVHPDNEIIAVMMNKDKMRFLIVLTVFFIKVPFFNIWRISRSRNKENGSCLYLP